MLAFIPTALTVVGLIGVVVAFLGAGLAISFQRSLPVASKSHPAVTILKPLSGDEPLLEDALASFGRIAYPEFQLVVGVQDPADKALAVVDQVRRRFPGIDLAVVVDPRIHGANRKVSNLINMLPAARHDVLVFSDSDLHVAPDYLDHLVAALEQPGCGLVTTVCTGQATGFGPVALAARLGAMQISHSFLPGVMLSRWLGRQDALGTTMALHRRTLALAGGLDGLLPHLADDQVLGRRVRALGLSVGLAAAIPVTSVAEASYRSLWQHELRWARTIRALAPAAFIASLMQFPLFWLGLACLLSGGDGWTAALFAAGWLARVACAAGINRASTRVNHRACDRACGRAGVMERQGRTGLKWREWLLWPARDALSVALVAASFCGDRVTWRGHVMHADAGRAAPRRSVAYALPD